MFNENINYPYITDYISRTVQPSSGLLAELEQYAAIHHIPILEKEAAAFLRTLTAIVMPRRILEIGAAIGYSALLMYEASGADIVTIERDVQLAELARDNIRRAGADIYVACGDALEELRAMSDPFDLIFVDAAKGQYPLFFAECMRLTRAGGVMLLDNVLFKGRVANDEFCKKKSRTIETRMREFLTDICHDERLTVSIVPIGDGMAVIKRERD